MSTDDFKINECDKCVYYKETQNGYAILCLHVNDKLIVGGDDQMVKSTKIMLNLRFDMKNIGLENVILGIKILRTLEGFNLNQSHYVDKNLKKFNKNDSNIARTSLDINIHLSKHRG